MIVTERLILRRWHDADRAPFAAMGADPLVMQYFPSLLTHAESDVLIDRVEAHFSHRGYGMWVIQRRADDVFLGFTGLMDINFVSPIDKDVEIGWRLATHAWGQGYAEEAARASLAWAWANLAAARIVAMTIAANTRSWELMARLEMARRPDLDFDHPRLADADPMRPHIVYAIDRR